MANGYPADVLVKGIVDAIHNDLKLELKEQVQMAVLADLDSFIEEIILGVLKRVSYETDAYYDPMRYRNNVGTRYTINDKEVKV